jgi:hypothetical protein
MPVEVLGRELSSEALFEAADAQASAPRPHAGLFPDGNLDRVDFCLTVEHHLALALQGDVDPRLRTVRAARMRIHAAVDAEPRLDDIVLHSFIVVPRL